MIVYDKSEVKNALTTEDVYELLVLWGGEPNYTDFGIVSRTICHNKAGEGSRKLYFYSNTSLFRCFTGCPEDYFDIFELYVKVQQNQNKLETDLNEAVRWIAQKFGISGKEEIGTDESDLEDWKYLANYSRIQNIEIKNNEVVLKEYDPIILDRFNYDVKITPWLEEGISQEILDKARIGFYPGDDQITIPHYDKNDRFIGLRGRTVVQEDAEKYGKYRPLRAAGQIYNHPLGMNLYNLNNSKDKIKVFGKALVVEGEKSALKYRSYFGDDNDISVACCGSSLTSYQVQLLLEAGAREIIVGFDRQFQKIGDEEFLHLKNNLVKLKQKYKNSVNMSFIFDKNMITKYKDSPLDRGPEIFLKLFKERIYL